MQIQWTTGFMQRMLFNASKAYVKQLEKEGREEGEAIGMEKGKHEVALRLLKKGLSNEEVSEMVGVSMEVLKNLKSCKY